MFPYLVAQVADAAETASESASTSPAETPSVGAKLMSGDFTHISESEWIYLGKISIMSALFVLILLFLAWTISAWISSAVAKGLRRVKFDETLTRFIAKLVRWGILLLVALMCLSYFGVETTSFAAVIGAAVFSRWLGVSGHTV